MPLTEHARRRMLPRLELLYGEQAGGVLSRIDDLADRYGTLRDADRGDLWDQRTVVLITYGDQVRGAQVPALEAQRQFLLEYGLQHLIDCVHILPFFPYSSDDGFSVIDYHRVSPDVGGWSDIQRLGESFGLMFDFVCNHCSQQNEWFQRYLRGESPYDRYFLEIDPAADVAAVTRPRSTPLLTPFATSRGVRHVWTTFSDDQVDLNFACPDVLLEMLDVLLSYVQRGARIIRLDAIGFLWKKIGTTCMHLPQTHAAVKIMRDLLDDLAPGAILLTETNVPHAENVSYFGDGDEAHAVYQFSLAPLLLDAFLTGDARPLRQWLGQLEYPGSGMTFFNFTASHDGIGVRPLEGLVPPARLQALVRAVQARGGLVSTRRQPDGTDVPYELNVTYFSALGGETPLPPDVHARRFLASQAFMLALRGIPGVYFHSLVGTANDHAGVQATGRNRSINRRKFAADQLRKILDDDGSAPRAVFAGYRHLLEMRIAQPAFHPDADQQVLPLPCESLVGFRRTSQDGSQQIAVVTNAGSRPQHLDAARLADVPLQRDLLSGQSVAAGNSLQLEPFQTVWLA